MNLWPKTDLLLIWTWAQHLLFDGGDPRCRSSKDMRFLVTARRRAMCQLNIENAISIDNCFVVREGVQTLGYDGY